MHVPRQYFESRWQTSASRPERRQLPLATIVYGLIDEFLERVPVPASGWASSGALSAVTVRDLVQLLISKVAHRGTQMLLVPIPRLRIERSREGGHRQIPTDWRRTARRVTWNEAKRQHRGLGMA